MENGGFHYAVEGTGYYLGAEVVQGDNQSQGVEFVSVFRM